jgi:hypothetical protein
MLAKQFLRKEGGQNKKICQTINPKVGLDLKEEYW